MVGDVCYYDMVLFCELFGGSNELPKNVPPTCHDVNQDIAEFFDIDEKEAFGKNREEILAEVMMESIDEVMLEEFPKTSKHNALYDAIVTKCIYEVVN